MAGISPADFTKTRIRNRILSKRVFIFDLDGTLAPSKQPLQKDVARLLARLLESKKVAVISGGAFKQFQTQFLKELKAPKELFKNLLLFPTNSTTFYRYKNGWHKVYENRLKRSETEQILKAFSSVFKEIGYKKPAEVYGRVLEDRGTQVTFSALGQKAPLSAKINWNKKSDARPLVMKRLKAYIPKFEIRSGGLTSIDITRRGIDKNYGVRKIMKLLGAKKKDVIFFGDAIYPGGNDYPVVKTGIDFVQVKNPKELVKIIKFK